MKDNMIYVIQISVKYAFHKNHQAHKFLKTYCKFLMAEIVNASIWLTIFSCLATIIETSLGYFFRFKTTMTYYTYRT